MLYIPTQQQRIKIYTKIKDKQQQDKLQLRHSETMQNNGKQYCWDRKKLSKQQITNLVNRLTKDTKREYIINLQTENIRKVNQEKQKNSQHESKVEERLLKAGKQLQLKKQKLLEEQLKKQQSTLQPFPKILDKSKWKISKPLIQRVDQMIQDKQQILRKLTHKYDPLFKPQLNPYSLFIAEVGSSKNFLQRVQEHHVNKKQNEVEKLKIKQQQEMDGVTFNPKINQKSKKIVSMKSKSSSLPKNQRSTHQISTTKNKYNFQPQINKKSQQIIKDKNNYKIQFHERLYEDMKRVSQKKLQRQKQIESYHSFKPKINKKSLRILHNKQNQHQQDESQNSDEDNLNNKYQQVFFDKQKLFPSQPQSLNTSKQHNEFPFNKQIKTSYTDCNKQNINSVNHNNRHANRKIEQYTQNIDKMKFNLTAGLKTSMKSYQCS